MKNINKFLILYISLILFIIFLYFTYKYYKTNKNSFIVTTNNYVLNNQCPDYLIYNGNKYYLIYNKNFKDYLEFNTLSEVYVKLDELKCPKFKPVYLIDNKNNDELNDPIVNYNRLCNKEISEGNFIKGIYNFEITDNDKNTSSWFDSESINNYRYLAVNFLGLTDFKNKTNQEIKDELNNFIENAKAHELVNYNHELCMIDKLAKTHNIGSFYDLYNSVNFTGKDKINENINYPNINLNEPITSLTLNKIFSVNN